MNADRFSGRLLLKTEHVPSSAGNVEAAETQATGKSCKIRRPCYAIGCVTCARWVPAQERAEAATLLDAGSAREHPKCRNMAQLETKGKLMKSEVARPIPSL